MIRLWRNPKSFLLMVAGGGLAGAAALFALRSQFGLFPAMSLTPAANKFPGESKFRPEDVGQLLVALPFEPLSSATAPVLEPAMPANVPVPTDLDKLGRNQSRFVVANKWATIRYLGPNPAGAGLSGEALNQAQTAALGSENDTVPVVTAAVTISNMMENYYAPLLQSFPEGAAALPRIYVQGAYFAPTYRTSGGNVSTDNAYIVGLQSLYLFPSSCFFKAREGECAGKFYSTGHDPTVVGHELGHVIFNQLRHAKGLEGFQWFAVNEALADYFSAAYFSEPLIGRIWRVSRPNQSHLRRLLDNPTTSEPSTLQEAHKFSVVWSSTLWRIRKRLKEERGVGAGEIDRTVLRSILFLGNTVNPRMGDAAAALIQAATSYKLDDWVPLIREELARAEISIAEKGDFSVERRGNDINTETQLTGAVGNCGSVPGAGGKSSLTAMLFLLAAPALALARKRRPSVRRSS